MIVDLKMTRYAQRLDQLSSLNRPLTNTESVEHLQLSKK